MFTTCICQNTPYLLVEQDLGRYLYGKKRNFNVCIMAWASLETCFWSKIIITSKMYMIFISEKLMKTVQITKKLLSGDIVMSYFS